MLHKQHGNKDVILKIHFLGNPGNSLIFMIFNIFTAYYPLFAILFMQHWGLFFQSDISTHYLRVHFPYWPVILPSLAWHKIRPLESGTQSIMFG